jgi:hypothetical protein
MKTITLRLSTKLSLLLLSTCLSLALLAPTAALVDDVLVHLLPRLVAALGEMGAPGERRARGPVSGLPGQAALALSARGRRPVRCGW